MDEYDRFQRRLSLAALCVALSMLIFVISFAIFSYRSGVICG